MTFAEKLKNSRKAAGMSQEIMAEKLGVSRQAITKWETDRGIPDVENMIAISNLFGITVDEFLLQEKSIAVPKGYLYESRTEYDIDGGKRFDIKFGGAQCLRVTGTDDEKIIVNLASDHIAALETYFKVKIDDIKGRVDVDVVRKNGITETKAKEELIINVFLPNQYVKYLELEANCAELYLVNITCEHMEFGGKAKQVTIDSVETVFELDCNLDMDVRINSFKSFLEINQISATSGLSVPDTFCFGSVVKGLSNAIYYECAGNPVDDFSQSDACNVVELNGIRSELIIAREGAGK